MTNAQIIAQLSADHIRDMEFLMQDGATYDEALERVKARSVAGAGVWRAVAQHFGKEAA